MEGFEVHVLASHMADHHLQCLGTLNARAMPAAGSEFVTGSDERKR